MGKKVTATYQITHVDTGIFYIGSTNNMIKRKNDHLYNLRKGQHASQKLQEAFNKSDDVDVIYREMPDRESAYDLEQEILNRNLNNPLLSNASPTARTTEGIKQSAESNKLRSIKSRDFRHTDETKKIISEKVKNNINPQNVERIVASSKSRIGIPLSEEHREKLSLAGKGRVLTEEHKNKISQAHKGQPKTEEQIRKMVESRGDFKHTEETKLRIKQSMLEHRQKLREEKEIK